MKLSNQTTRENNQKDIDTVRGILTTDLSEKDKEKHKIVEECLNTLAINNIPAYIFAQLPIIDKKSSSASAKTVIQYNTLNNTLSEYEDNYITSEGARKLSIFNALFFRALLTCSFTFKGLYLESIKDKEDLIKKCDILMRHIYGHVFALMKGDYTKEKWDKYFLELPREYAPDSTEIEV